MISLDFSATFNWLRTKRLSVAQALTIWMADLPQARSCERRKVLLSMATT